MMSTEKTEKPTARKLQKSREDGQVARSSDLNGAFVLGGFLLVINYYCSYAGSLLMGLLQTTLGQPYHSKVFTVNTLLQWMQETLQTWFLLTAPLMGAIMLAAIASNLMQVGPLLTTKPLMPKLDKINPLGGFKRLFSIRSVVELLKGLLKMAVLGAVGYSVLSGAWPEISRLSSATPMELASTLMSVFGSLLFNSVLAYLTLGVADWRYQAYEHEKQLRMSKQDIKDEAKGLEGDAQMKGRIRQMGQSMIKKQQLNKVPTADVVVTNPTHYAVALRYDPDIAPAPHIVAKGLDHFALKIKETAKESGVEVIENRSLARALYASAEYGDMIPPDLFVAVAEVLAFVYKKHGGRQLYARKKQRKQEQNSFRP